MRGFRGVVALLFSVLILILAFVAVGVARMVAGGFARSRGPASGAAWRWAR
jgi:hypothetical protein